MIDYRWIYTHSYPDYNIVLTKRYVKTKFLEKGLIIGKHNIDLLHKLTSRDTDFFIDEVANCVKSKKRKRVKKEDIYQVLQKYCREFIELSKEIDKDFGKFPEIVKLWYQDGDYYVYFHFKGDLDLKKYEIEKIFDYLYYFETKKFREGESLPDI